MEANGKFFRRKAKWPATCVKCQGQIIQNHYFTWDRTKEGKGRAWHYDCAAPFSRPSGSEEAPSESSEQHFEKEVPPEIRKGYEKILEASENKDEQSFAEERIETPKVETKTEETMPSWIEGLARDLLPILDGKIKAKGDENIEALTALFNEYCEKLESRYTHKIEVKAPSGEVKKIDGVHYLFAKLMYLVSVRDWAYLHGAPGSFKSTSAKLAAEMNDLDFDSIPLNVFTLPSALYGYMDANGQYVTTGFRRCYEFGGVFLIDEMDNGAGNLLTMLNAALANGYASFPDKLVKIHPNFVCIATGNTAGRGGNRNHAERRALDAATLDRFRHLNWDYDWKLVYAATLAINPKAGNWAQWVKSVSEYCARELPHVLATPRASFGGARLLLDGSPFSVAEVAEMTVFKGIDKASRERITTAHPLPVDPREVK